MSRPIYRLLAATRLCYTQALSVELIYRWALMQGFFGVIVGLVGLLLFWLAAGRSPGAGSVYPTGMLVAYFVVTSAHALVNENQLTFNISTGIRLGKLSASMLRPFPYLLAMLAQAAAQATIRLVFLVPVVAVLIFTVEPLGVVAAQVTGLHLLYYAAALVIGVVAGWLIKVGVGLLAFDLTQTWGPELIFLAVFSVASGVSYPADLLSGAVLAVVRWTPVYYMIGFPALVLLGRVDEAEVVSGLGRGVVVAVLTAVVVWLMWRRGTRRFEAVGI